MVKIPRLPEWVLYFKMIKALILAAVDGNRSLMEERLSLCMKQPCPNYNVNATCSLCGCMLRVKARDPKLHCPKKITPLW